MSRYAVTYRIDGGPGFSGWAERTCNSVNVYANKDDMTPVNGATIFDKPASITTYGGLGNIISVGGGTVIAYQGGRVFHETF